MQDAECSISLFLRPRLDSAREEMDGLIVSEPSAVLARSLSEFQALFPNDESCAAYLFERRWPEGFVCPACGARRYGPLKKRAYTYECRDCACQTSITSGTVMHRSHLALTRWFWATHLIVSHHGDVSARQLSKLLRVTYKTAWLLEQKLKRLLDRKPLEGLVEIGHAEIPFRGADESLDPRRRGRIIVAGALSSLEIRIAAIPDDSSASIEAFVRSNVKAGAKLVADSSLNICGYEDAPQQADGARRLPITFGLLRRYQRRRREPLDTYLRKFAQYHNDRYREISFDAVLRIAAHHEPISYQDIIGRDNPGKGH